MHIKEDFRSKFFIAALMIQNISAVSVGNLYVVAKTFEIEISFKRLVNIFRGGTVYFSQLSSETASQGFVNLLFIWFTFEKRTRPHSK